MKRGIDYAHSYQRRYEVVDDTIRTWGVRDMHKDELVAQLLERMTAEELAQKFEYEWFVNGTEARNG